MNNKNSERTPKSEMVGQRLRYRLKFTKSGPVRFIGHLDLMSLFAMAIKRAALPIAYSEGFNPHQLISFALPLSLGYYSNGEYVDIALKTDVNCKKLVEALNQNLPDGLMLIAAKAIHPGEKSGAALVSACAYKVLLPEAHRVSVEVAKNFISQDTIVISKKTKKSVADIDILPDIYHFELQEKDGLVTEINMRISAGPNRSIRADSVMKALFDFSGKPYPEYGLIFVREEMYQENAAAPAAQHINDRTLI